MVRRRDDAGSVVVADTEPITREGIARVLAAAGFGIAGQTDDIEVAIELVGRHHAAALIVDLRVPGVSIAALCREVSVASPDTAVVVFNALGPGLIPALDAGASAVVTKESPCDVLVEAVRAVVAGATFVDPALATAAWLASPPDNRKAVSPIGLTVQELRVLSLLPRGFTNDEIAHELHISKDTVKTHIANVQRKLHVDSRTKAAMTALRLGLA